MNETKKLDHQKHTLSHDLEHKLLNYSIIAGAALAIGHSPAEAAVQYTPYGLPGIGISGTSFNLDLDNNGINDFNLAIAITTFNNLSTAASSGSSYGMQNYAQINGANSQNSIRVFGGTPQVFNAGDLIQVGGNAQTTTLAMRAQQVFGTWAGSSGFFVTNTNTVSNGPFLNNQGFLGAHFDIAGNSNVAWIDVAVNADVSLITVFGWGYEDQANTAITAGDQGLTPVPLPAAGALFSLALGAGALMERRRRQKIVKDELAGATL